jgi:hypothetical protein
VHEGIGVGEEGILAAWGVGEPGGAEAEWTGNCFWLQNSPLLRGSFHLVSMSFESS